jgi:hypothetical protein
MEQAKHIIETVLSTAQNPCVFWSAGKDSQLLLSLIREHRDIDVILYADKLSSFQEQVVMDLNLTVYLYSPGDAYYLPNKDGVALVREYPVGGAPFPVIWDVEHSDKCGLEISKAENVCVHYPWDTVFIGWKATDEHYITGKNPFPPNGTQVGTTKFYAPLRHLSDEQVLEELDKRGIAFDPENGTESLR